jgi:hypothetical protein
MSSALVGFIGAVYLVASASFALEGRYAWALLNLFWGGGNLVISYLSWAR